ncbi:MAG: DUF2339 domain-containing protein [Dehalococcoidia bacterium]
MNGGAEDSSIQVQLRELRQTLSVVAARIETLEKAYAPSPPVTARSNAAPPTVTTPSAAAPVGPPAATQPAAAHAPSSPTRASAPPSFDWEQLLGRNWFAIAGAVALAVGIGFFLRLAFENEWIGTTERVLLGLGCGLALVGAGEWTYRRYPLWAQAVTGGGVAVLYLSAYAAFGFYQIIGPIMALILLTAVAAACWALALRHESLAIALLGIGGAFLTPLLLGSGLPGTALLLTYILLIDAGIVGISTFRNWRWLTLLGLAGSYALFAVWLGNLPQGQAVLAQAGLTGIFLLFTWATTMFHILWRRQPGVMDLALMTSNGAAYYGVTFGLLWQAYESWFGAITLGLAALYGLIAYAAKRNGAPGNVSLFGVSIALVFLTVAVPLQLGGPWITLGWLAEGTALIWLGMSTRDWRLRTAGLAGLLIGTGHMAVFDLTVDFSSYRPLLNVRFLVFTLAIAAWSASAYLYHRGRTSLEDAERYNALALVLVANGLTLALLSLEAASFFESLGRAGALGYVQAHHYAHFTLTAIGTVHAAALVTVGLARSLPVLRMVGIGLLAVAIAKLVLYDTTLVQMTGFQPVLNARFVLFVFSIAACYGMAYLYHSQEGTKDEWERQLTLVLGMTAAALTLAAFSAEAIAYFDSTRQPETEQAKQLALTLLWGSYAAGLIAVGILWRITAVRLAGAGLLAVTILKLFGYDVFLLDRGYRVAAFITLGMLLLATGLAYQRYSQVMKGFLLGKA